MVKKKRGEAMKNILEIDGYGAIIMYDPETDQFRGEFIGLNGGADFYGRTIDQLKTEGKKSLKVFFDICNEEGLNTHKQYSGKFNLRVPPVLHAEIATKAAAEGKSLNQYVVDILNEAI